MVSSLPIALSPHLLIGFSFTPFPHGIQSAMKLLNSPGCFAFRFEGLHLIETICCHEITRDEGLEWRKTPSLLGPPVLKKDVTIPAIEEDITGPREALG